jgi:DNA-binding XRE family transcriptional regulator
MKRIYLVDLRKQNNIKQAGLARQLSLKQNSYSCIENGLRRKKLTIELASKLAKAFHITVSEIIELENEYQCSPGIKVV